MMATFKGVINYKQQKKEKNGMYSTFSHFKIKHFKNLSVVLQKKEAKDALI